MEGSKTSSTKSLTVGPVILVDERNPDLSYRLLRELSAVGRKVLRISRDPPERVMARYPLAGAEHYWLVTEESGRTSTPFRLKRIAVLIGMFVRRNPAAVISIEGIEFLMVMNGFANVRDFLLRLRKTLPKVGGACIIGIDVRTLTARELEELAGAFPMMRGASGE